LSHASAAAGYGYISEKFDSVEGYGPTCVRRFVEETRVLGNRTADQWQQDAFGQVDAWLRALGLRGLSANPGVNPVGIYSWDASTGQSTALAGGDLWQLNLETDATRVAWQTSAPGSPPTRLVSRPSI
jgi:hypothetical protein